MAPKKLSESDKQEIITLYRQTEETTSTIASRYGVSNTTISRILKQSLSEDEYETLIHHKRTGARGQADLESAVEPVSIAETIPIAPSEPVATIEANEPLLVPNPSEVITRRQRKRSTVASTLNDSTPAIQSELPLLDLVQPDTSALGEADTGFVSETSTLQEILEEEILDSEEDFEDELDQDDDDDDDELDQDDDEDDDDDEIAAGGEELASLAAVHIPFGGQVQVLPLSEASVPKTFYLVVDRSSELITRPLKDFADLGQIPDEETQEKTLPIFDNHRVAKRFLRRMQRVVKVPDGRVLHKVSPYLQAKGITRLLIDGRIYSI